MPLDPRIIADKALTKRMFDHYEYRLKQFQENEDNEPLISEPIKKYLDEWLKYVQGVRDWAEKTEFTPLRPDDPYQPILLEVLGLYKKDVREIADRAKKQFPSIRLSDLEADLDTLGHLE